MPNQPRSLYIPDNLLRTATELRGEEGLAWIDQLPAIVAECERRWTLEVGLPFLPLSYNYVAPAVRADGTAAVLKVCIPGHEFATEEAALRHFDGHGMARLLDSDGDLRILLLERLEPGTPLRALEDDVAQSTSIATGVLRQLWRPAPLEHAYPTVAKWADGMKRLRAMFDGGTGPLPVRVVEEAERHFADLLASSAAPVVLHGDLHHDNIRTAQRQPWLAIDPKGVVGEPAYDTGCWLRNLPLEGLTDTEARRMLARCVAQLADELGFDRERVRAWGMAQAVLSAWWTVEDHGHEWQPAIACAEHLAAIKPTD